MKSMKSDLKLSTIQDILLISLLWIITYFQNSRKSYKDENVRQSLRVDT